MFWIAIGSGDVISCEKQRQPDHISAGFGIACSEKQVIFKGFPDGAVVYLFEYHISTIRYLEFISSDSSNDLFLAKI